MRKGKELKAPRYASAAATRDYIITHNIILNNNLNNLNFLLNKKDIKYKPKKLITKLRPIYFF